MALSTLSLVQQISQETKHRANISLRISNNSSQAQEFNIPDVLVTIQVAILIAQNNVSLPSKSISVCAPLFIIKLVVKNPQFRQRFWNILEELASYWSNRLGTQNFWNIYFLPKMSPSRQILPNCSQKCRQAPPGIKLRA